MGPKKQTNAFLILRCKDKSICLIKKKNMINFHEIENIIFDIGDVLLNISKLKAYEALKKLPIKEADLKEMLLLETGDYFKYEQGAINSSEFRDSFRKLATEKLNDEQINTAWCGMLEDFPEERINELKRLSKRYKTYILSNTNEIHINAFNQQLKTKYNISSLDDIVEKAYYSNEILLRKPDSKIYEYLLNDAKIEAKKTLFIDDREENLKMAEKYGIKTFLFTKKIDFKELFKNA